MTLDDVLHQFIGLDAFSAKPIGEMDLLRLLAVTRSCPSLSDVRPLKYLLGWRPSQINVITHHVHLGSELDQWPKQCQNDVPIGYIVIMADTQISSLYDWEGRVAAHAILLGAAVAGLDGCVFTNVDREALCAILGLPDHLRILAIVGLHRPIVTMIHEDGSPVRRSDCTDHRARDRRDGWGDCDSYGLQWPSSVSDLCVESPVF